MLLTIQNSEESFGTGASGVEKIPSVRKMKLDNHQIASFKMMWVVVGGVGGLNPKIAELSDSVAQTQDHT